MVVLMGILYSYGIYAARVGPYAMSPEDERHTGQRGLHIPHFASITVLLYDRTYY